MSPFYSNLKEYCVVCYFRPIFYLSYFILPISTVEKHGSSNERFHLNFYYYIFTILFSCIIGCIILVYLYQQSIVCATEHMVKCLVLTTDLIYIIIGSELAFAGLFTAKKKEMVMNTLHDTFKLHHYFGFNFEFDPNFNKYLAVSFIFTIVLTVGVMVFTFFFMVYFFEENSFGIFARHFLSSLSNYFQITIVYQFFVTQALMRKLYSSSKKSMINYLTLCLPHDDKRNKPAKVFVLPQKLNLAEFLNRTNEFYQSIHANYRKLNGTMGLSLAFWLVHLIAMMIVNVYLILIEWDDYAYIVGFIMARTLYMIVGISSILFINEDFSGMVSTITSFCECMLETFLVHYLFKN